MNAAFFDPDDAARPVDSVAVVRGLRIIHLDSSVPGAGHGHLDAAQLSWLAEVLADPAPHGSVLVVHHPPTPTSSELMGLVALRNPADLARALRGSDVRIILSGHMHASGTSMLAGIPVAICGALSHAADPLYDHLGHRGMTEGQSFTIVEFFADQVVTNVVPLTAHPTLRMVRPAEVAARLAR